MTRTPRQSIDRTVRSLPWNFRLKFWISHHHLLIVLSSLAAIVLLTFVKRAVSDWRLLLPLVVGLLSFAYTVQKQELEEVKLFRELFCEFNRRYDEMDRELNQIRWEDDPKKALSSEQKLTLYRYFNLCAEEFLYFRKGYIDPKVWDAWLKGMKIYCQNTRIREFWAEESKTDSYYGFELPCTAE